MDVIVRRREVVEQFALLQERLFRRREVAGLELGVLTNVAMQTQLQALVRPTNARDVKHAVGSRGAKRVGARRNLSDGFCDPVVREHERAFKTC